MDDHVERHVWPLKSSGLQTSHKNTQRHRYVKIFTLEAVLENGSTTGVLDSLFHCVLMNIELKIGQTLDDARVVIAEETSINLFF